MPWPTVRARLLIALAFACSAARFDDARTAKFVPPDDSTAFSDDFESYADQAAFEKAWPKTGAPAYHFDDTFGHDSKKSVKLEDIPNLPGAGNGASNRYYRNLSHPLTPTDDTPVIFSFDLYLDPAGAPDQWSRAWHTVDLRGYSDGGFGRGDVTGIISMGVARLSANPWSASYFQTRIFTGADADIRKQYYTLNEALNAPRRAAGWHTLSAHIGATSVAYFVDGIPAQTVKGGLTKPLTTLILGSDVSSGGNVMSVDNLTVFQDRPKLHP